MAMAVVFLMSQLKSIKVNAMVTLALMVRVKAQRLDISWAFLKLRLAK